MRRKIVEALDAETLRRLRQARADGLTWREIGSRFGFSSRTAEKAVKGAVGK